MAEEITVELKKPLDKMTAKELRALIMDKLPMITGASGMDKDELVTSVKAVLGISEEPGSVSPYKAQIHDMKRQIREMRVQKLASTERKQRDILRRRINKLKKRSRSLSRTV
jgi:hypothetical protein